MKTKITLIEDDLDLGLVLKQYLEFSGFEVTWFNNPTKIIEELTLLKDTDLIILDVMMPEIDGFTLSKIVKKQVDKPFLFLTAKAQSFDRVLGLKLGADDYITKPCDPEELVLRIKNILKRTSQFSNKNEVIIGKYIFSQTKMMLVYKDEIIQLTEKESELLKYFLENNGKLITRKEILETIWGENDYFLGRSLDVFMTRLRKYFRHDPTIRFDSIRGVGFNIELPL